MNAVLSGEDRVSGTSTSPVLKWAAIFFSYVLHPIFVPFYAIWFLVYVHPSYFSGFSAGHKAQVLFITVLNLVFFPVLSVILLKAVGFIESFFLRKQKDRIIPYMACGIFFFWAYTVFKQQDQYPPIISSFILGIFLASSGGLLANIYFKVSMHTIGMGGLCGLFIIIAASNTMLMTWPLSIVLLLTGIVCTSRLLVSDHTQKEIYTGFFIGLLSQFIAAFVVA
jgi:hypothetical protein